MNVQRQPDTNVSREDEEDEDEDDDDDDTKPIANKTKRVSHQIPDSSEIKITTPSNRNTSEYTAIYEYSMIVGTRAMHIGQGSVLYTDPQGLHDPRYNARKEINENMCPLSITCKVSPSIIEIWEVNEMIKPQL
ncbi:hypothetical protein JG688_00015015 [Phytophthora aleatoria]|uniref:Uncharacterized protein n=1 Tax=Phytophthora aleatoria TaxID=2496075 RepID=A0A8J5IKH8_9STRA|nr:hypothetical protein JG688_00015015 [Phytophthora aleatoria]